MQLTEKELYRQINNAISDIYDAREVKKLDMKKYILVSKRAPCRFMSPAEIAETERKMARR